MKACENGVIKGGKVVRLVCDKPGAYVLERAKKYQVPSFVFVPKTYAGKEEFEAEIASLLKEEQVDLIVLAGYMRLIGSVLLKEYQGRIINLHPSLLPAFTGKDAVKQAFNYGVKLTGVTVHFVDEGLDTGPIITQRCIPVEEGDTLQSLTEKIQSLEHQILPEVIQWIVEDRVSYKGRQVYVKTREDMFM